MTASKNNLVSSTFLSAVEDPSSFTDTFKRRLFARDSSLKRLFEAGQEASDGAVVEVLTAVVDALSDKSALAALAEEIAVRFQAASIQPRHYGVIGQALLDTLELRLGATYTEEVHDAWADVYVRVAEAVMAARYNTMELVA